MTKPMTYADSGVNINAGNALVDAIGPLASATTRPGVMGALGGFGGLFDLKACGYKDPVLVAATDGVGTKLALAYDYDAHDTIGIDLVAMCVNDLLAQGADPLFFLDYYATGRLDPALATRVISGITQGCKQANCALIGGETAEMPGMYEDTHYDLAGFAIGAVERDAILPDLDAIKPGDYLVAVPSSGLHSNGFSLVRRLINQHHIDLNKAPEFDCTFNRLVDCILAPTRIYIPFIQGLRSGGIHFKALAHITGGGLLENIPRVLPKNRTMQLNLDTYKRPELFDWLAKLGAIEPNEMLRTFNCGIGLVLVCAPEQADALLQHDITCTVIGSIA